MRLPRLVALTTGELEPAAFPAFLRGLGAAVDAGLDGLLVREPALSDRALAELVEKIRTALGPERLWVGVHDRVHVAVATGADAAHLGYRSLTPSVVRACFPGLALGFSAHATDEPGARDGADYLFLGPLNATPSKAGLVDPLGLEAFAREVAAQRPRPVYAIGGLAPEDGPSVLASGAQGLAVLRGVFGQPDPGAATQRYVRSLAPVS